MPTVNEPRPDGQSVSQQLWLVVQTGPALPITDVAFSPDGQFLVNAGDATPRVWKLESGEVVRELTGHRLPATVAAFSPDGKYVLTGGYDSFVRLWDWREGTLAQSFGPHLRVEGDSTSPGVQHIAMTGDGQIVMTTDLTEANRATIVLWNAKTSQELRRFGNARAITAAAMSADGKRVAFANERHEIEIWNAANGQSSGVLRGHSMPINALAFSPDHQQLASASDDRTGRLWEVDSAKESHLLPGHFERVTDVAYSADGSRVATSSADSTARLWDPASGRMLHKFSAAGPKLLAVAMSADGNQLIAGGDDLELHRFTLEGDPPAGRIRGKTTELTSAIIVADPPMLVAATPSEYCVWDLRAGRQSHRRALSGQRLFMAPGGRFAVTMDDTSKLQLHSVLSNDPPRTLPNPAGEVASVQFADEDRQVIVFARDGSVRVWNCDSLQLLHHWQRDEFQARDFRAQVLPSGQQLVSLGYQGGQIFSLADGKKLGELAAEKHTVDYLAATADTSLLVTRDHRHYVVWDGTTLLERLRFPANFAPADSALLFASHDSPVMFSPDHLLLAIGDAEDVRLIDVATGKLLRTITGHSEPVLSITFTQDGERLVTTSADQTCRIWNTATGERIASLASLRTGGWVIIDDVGRYDGSDNGNVEGIHWVVGDETISLPQLKQRYYEPQLLAKTLGYNREPRREVAAFSTPKLFPRFEVQPPTAEQAALKIKLENRGGGIGRVVIRINGKEITADARGENIRPDAAAADISVDLTHDPRLIPGEVNVVEVMTCNQEGYLASRDRRVIFRAPGRSEAPEPALWAIVAGASNYRGEAIDLRYAAKDAEDFAAALRLGAERLFGAGQVHLTLLSTAQSTPEHQPTRTNLLAALESAKASRPGDMLVLYLAGHGVNLGSQDGDFYYLTSDAEDAELADPALRSTTAVSSTELSELLRQIPALKQVMVLDTCASGRLVEKLTENRSVPSSQLRALERVKERTGMYVLAGCAADAVSYEASRFGQGLLTHSLLLGMRGAALREEEFVDVSSLFNFAADRVPEMARDIGGIQRPAIASPKGGGSFDIGRITPEDRAQIPLQSPLPLVLRANFQDEVEFADTLSLSPLLNNQLRAVSTRDSKPLVFIDAAQLPSAFRIFGRYDVDGDNVEVRVHLFQDKERVAQFSVKGTRNELETLAAEIVRQSQVQLNQAKQ
ncbi:caspase family protein [Lignipirellula cremea]|uniref:caspase family protein n=1 Tax=Lignipirellula cremea TaxID=2528010 RepID=UPI0018D1FE51|nr:caspase family protein [Lignipirellula cremea]